MPVFGGQCAASARQRHLRVVGTSGLYVDGDRASGVGQSDHTGGDAGRGRGSLFPTEITATKCASWVRIFYLPRSGNEFF